MRLWRNLNQRHQQHAAKAFTQFTLDSQVTSLSSLHVLGESQAQAGVNGVSGAAAVQQLPLSFFCRSSPKDAENQSTKQKSPSRG
jgi:hypothetical protein